MPPAHVSDWPFTAASKPVMPATRAGPPAYEALAVTRNVSRSPEERVRRADMHRGRDDWDNRRKTRTLRRMRTPFRSGVRSRSFQRRDESQLTGARIEEQCASSRRRVTWPAGCDPCYIGICQFLLRIPDPWAFGPARRSGRTSDDQRTAKSAQIRGSLRSAGGSEDDLYRSRNDRWSFVKILLQHSTFLRIISH